MFLDYRIRKLQAKVDAQKAMTGLLEVAHVEYGCSYYTNKLHESHIKWLNLNSKLKWLKDKKQKRLNKGLSNDNK